MSENVLNRLDIPSLEDEPRRPWRFDWSAVGPLVWVLSITVIILTFVPGVGLTLGKLPGDLMFRSDDRVLYFPLMTSGLITVVIGGIFYLASNHLTRR